ncbi:MAG: type II toxin-antitoxin system RelE/ParE family toxin [Acidobacteriia bacterium]|nr:type II toxin-antitoxin system RelE/ParE family toxin [Terriglobia bacterium]
MIKSFGCADTEKLFYDENVPRFVNIRQPARRKLLMLHATKRLMDLKAPPGNRLHALEGDREGQHSISINDQWRICFVWRDGDAHNVEIVDYH